MDSCDHGNDYCHCAVDHIVKTLREQLEEKGKDIKELTKELAEYKAFEALAYSHMGGDSYKKMVLEDEIKSLKQQLSKAKNGAAAKDQALCNLQGLIEIGTELNPNWLIGQINSIRKIGGTDLGVTDSETEKDNGTGRD